MFKLIKSIKQIKPIKQIKQIKPIGKFNQLTQVQNYWVPPTPLNETKVLVPYPLVAKLDQIHQTLRTITKSQPLTYGSGQAICGELSKLNDSIEQIKKFNQTYSECVKYT
jgi:hypothetical protein